MDKTQYRNSIVHRISLLSQQELQVMQMLLAGAPNKYIAAHLELSPRTIVFRRKSLMQKMKANSLGELACLIQLVSGDHTHPLTAETSNLVDVHTSANLCEAVGRLNSKSGDYS
jgi:DNA-binding CsgD family transcriptional regulator